MKQMSAPELAEFLKDHSPLMLDVREVHELANGILDNAIHIPMNHVPARLSELETARQSPLVLICRSGQRSAQVGHFLEQEGFNDVINLDGGMNAWAAQIDNTMQVY
jgi:rhodanese-related sulfurtransferase